MGKLYLECNMGAAGDMLMAALLELLDDRTGFIDRLNSIGIPGVKVEAVPDVKCGITGTHIKVTVHGEEESAEHSHGDHQHEHDEHHHHSGMYEITHIIENLEVSDRVKANVLAAYEIIAHAESEVHGKTVDMIHFHEVGELDAVTDIVGVCMLIEELAPERIVVSPVNLGSGQVKCAHGILPVPAPATALIIKGMPVFDNGVKGELLTPTGAALLKHFANEFTTMPSMKVSKIGYGMGSKNFENANCVRAFWSCDNTDTGEDGLTDEVVELSCNLDDITPEMVAFACEILLENGALDVYTIGIGMKKGRAGVMLNCICREKYKGEMVRLIFQHTTTLGIRERISKRFILRRTDSEVKTDMGNIRIKQSAGYGVQRAKPEYEDVSRIAREQCMSLSEIIDIYKKG